MAAENVLEFTDDNFQAEVLDSDQPVLVDLWAPWCGPCKMLAPVIDELASDFEGKAKIGKMNTDENSQIPGSLGISAIPTVLIYKGGEIVERFVGMASKDQISATLTAQM